MESGGAGELLGGVKLGVLADHIVDELFALY